MDYYYMDMMWKIKDRIKTLNSNIKYINGYDIGYSEVKEVDDEIDNIIRNIWKISNNYRLAQESANNTADNKQDSLPVWYIMDEVGLAITHDEDPNFACVPFLHFTEDINKKLVCTTYNIMWPLKDIKAEEFITRDFTKGHLESTKNGKVGIWSTVEIAPFQNAYNEFSAKMKSLQSNQMSFLSNYSFANQNKLTPLTEEKVKLVTDDKLFKESLANSNRYEIVEEVEDCEFCFFTTPLQNYLTEQTQDIILSKKINQFPFESSLSNNFSVTNIIQQTLGYTIWLP